MKLKLRSGPTATSVQMQWVDDKDHPIEIKVRKLVLKGEVAKAWLCEAEFYIDDLDIDIELLKENAVMQPVSFLKEH